MLIKKILFLLNLMFSEAKAQTNAELRSKVLNALRAKTEVAEIKVTQSGSDKVQSYRYTVSDLNPASLSIQDLAGSKTVDVSEFQKMGLSAEVLAYSFFNSDIPTPFGMSKAYHITYTAVKTQNNSLSHFLVYYDKKNFYPVKVDYYNGNKKISTIEYLEYKKIKDKVWRAHVITSENHLNNKRTKVEYTKMEINSDSTKPALGSETPKNPL
tara:strand:+ start:8743 stop:9378 length:636 start_codon:yes stop_codon:yes gene_type:complete